MTINFKSRCIASDYPVINVYTAIWAMRIALSNPYSTLLTRDADDFLKISGEHLIWTKASLEKLLDKTSLNDEQKAEIRELGFQETWLQFQGDYTNSHDEEILKAFRRLARREKSVLNRVIKTSLSQLEKQVTKVKNPIMENALLLQELLELSTADCALLNFAGLMMQSKIAHILTSLIPARSFDDAIRSLATMLGIDTQNISAALKPSGLLVEFRLIEVCRDPKDVEDMLAVPVNVQVCLSEYHEDLDQMMMNFVRPAKSTSLTIDDYPHLDADRIALNRFLTGSCEQHAERVNIMFYGGPGTGKTEFAKVLACEAGFKLYEVASANKDGGSLSRVERLASLRISMQFLSGKKTLLLFDEIEDIFPQADNQSESNSKRSSDDYGKAWMNHMLENNPIPIIWVSNEIKQIDPAYLRRFSYHLEFCKPPLKVRQRIAEKYLCTTAVSRDYINQVAQKSAITPALVESTARVVSLSKVDDVIEAENLASRVIQQYQSAMGLNENSDLRISPTKYHLDYLNLDSRHSIEKIVQSLKLNPSATMCFYGLPGTGKTALAEHLARELDRPLFAKRASDILSKWVGGSEKNIANMFREAEAEGAILFLDEADSLLRNRENASRSWEVSQVNELLQQMERFNGIFICATNLFSDLDAAALRRFTFKISFKSMTPQQRERMFIQEALQDDVMLLDESIKNRLNRLDSLVPGDFAVVKRQSRILGAAVNPDDFLVELEAECRVKPNRQGRQIGFTA